jgi:hypothetical protein
MEGQANCALGATENWEGAARCVWGSGGIKWRQGSGREHSKAAVSKQGMCTKRKDEQRAAGGSLESSRESRK